MRKLLFLAEAVSLAHVGRPLSLAKWAFENGYEVHFACSKEGLQKTGTKDVSFSLHNLNTILPALFYERVNKGKFFYKIDELVSYVEEEKRLILQINPDLVISDFRLSAPISTWLCNKPLLNLSNSHWSPNSDCPFPSPNIGVFKWMPKFLREKIFSMIRPIAFRTFGKELNKVRALYGMPIKTDFRELYTEGTFTAYLDMPDFTVINNIPKNHFFLGPVMWSPSSGSQDISLSGKNNIYISMGSTGNNKLIHPIIKSALKSNAFIFISGVSPEEASKLIEIHPRLKDRCVISRLLDPCSILPQCKLTVCHGGSGTVYQSLSFGTPVLCFPTNPDQSLVSYAVHNKKLGRFIEGASPSQKIIDQAISACLNEKSIAKNVKTYSEEMSAIDAFQNWINFLGAFFLKPISGNTDISKDVFMKKMQRPSGVSKAFRQVTATLQASNSIEEIKPSGFTIKIANTLEEREKVFRLAYQVYREKGYINENSNEWLHKPYDADPETVVFIVQDQLKNIVGSITLVFDDSRRLPADGIYKEELDGLRRRGKKITEISRLVISPDYRNSKKILILLFNYLAIYAYHVKRYDDLIIEVNPRHKEYYKSILCFEEFGSEKPCPHVQNAPAVLLNLPLKRYQEEAHRCHQILSTEKKERTLYPYFLDLKEESLVANYLEKQVTAMTENEKAYFGFYETSAFSFIEQN